MDSIIEIKNIDYIYDAESEEPHHALKNFSLNIYPGEFVAVLGHNGSGKSTLAKLLNTLILPTKGDIIVDGINTKIREKTWDIRRNCGMVFQNPDNQIIATIVEEDIAFGPENLGMAQEDIKYQVDRALKIVEMEEYRNHAPHLLSGGQKQRVAIAGILAMDPEIIIMDEPTAMLDPIGREEIIETVKILHEKENKTILYITHFMQEAINADRIIVLEEGKIALTGSPKDVFSKVEEMKRLGLDVPQVTEMAYELRKSGIDIRSDILDIDELVNNL